MAKKVAQFALEMADREAIRDCLTRYSRGSDRIDREAMTAAYWPEATDDHGGIFEGKASDLIEHVIPLLKQLSHTTHFLGNMLIEVDLGSAKSETYVLAYYSFNDGEATSNIAVGGRYLDELDKRADEWRILRRTLVIDWVKNIPEPVEPAKSFVSYSIKGSRKPDDPSFRLFSAR